MHLRSADLKEWRADFQNPSRISLPSTPITNHGSGRHVDLRKCAYPLADGSEACPSFRTPRSFNRAICLSDDKFTTLRNTVGLVPFNEYFTPVTVPNKVLPILSLVASLVFHLHTFGFPWLSFSVLLCIRSPVDIFGEFDTNTSRYTELRSIFEHLFSVALSQRASTDRSSVSGHRL